MTTASALRGSAVVFDLDGTLLDTVPDSHAGLNAVFTAAGFPALTLEQVRTTVGEGARAMIERALAIVGQSLPRQSIDELLHKYLAACLLHPGQHTVIYDDAVDTLAALQDAGAILGICTNKPRMTTIAVLKALQLDRFFLAVLCPEDVPHRKPDGRHVLATLDALGVTPNEAVFVGDSETDIAAAKDAGIKSIFVTWGYCHVPPESLEADARIDRFADLIPTCAALGARPSRADDR